MSALQSKQNEREESASIKETEVDYLLSSEIGHVSPQFFLISWDTPWLRYCLVLITWAITIVLTIHFMSQKRQTFHSVIPEIFDTELSKKTANPSIWFESLGLSSPLILHRSCEACYCDWESPLSRKLGIKRKRRSHRDILEPWRSEIHRWAEWRARQSLGKATQKWINSKLYIETFTDQRNSRWSEASGCWGRDHTREDYWEPSRKVRCWHWSFSSITLFSKPHSLASSSKYKNWFRVIQV